MKLYDVEMREGWLWPSKDWKCWEWLQNEKDLPELIAKFCKNKNVVVQAGGNCGFYVKPYASLFETVYTFEPNAQNFYCLVNNVPEPNVIKFQACLGNEHQLVGITYKKSNAGVSRVDGIGKFPTMKIDDLMLEECDLIHLDVEGYEFFVLQGAENTIKKCKPVIVLEWLDHNSQFNVSSTDIYNWLTNLGYKEVGQVYHDKVFAI